jgi:hypothetical protein
VTQEVGSSFHCSPEFHLKDLSPICALVYPFALRVSKKSDRFAYSATLVARHFGYHPRRVQMAYRELTAAGFFVELEKGLFEPNVYKVLTHKEWAVSHPNACAIKETMPWEGDTDPLGRELYAISGGRAKFRDFQVKILRECASEAEIKSEFQPFWQQQTEATLANHFKSNRRAIIGRFVAHMKARASETKASIESVPAGEARSHGEHFCTAVGERFCTP